MSKRVQTRLCLFIALSTLVGLACTTAGAVADQAGRKVIDSLFPVSEEVKLGNKLSAELEKEVKLLDNQEVVAYVAGLGGKVLRAAKDKPAGIRFRFKVIKDDNTVNAFAMPGGHVYVYTGLLKAASNEAELLSVLCHEVAHVTQRHIAENLIAANGLETVLQLAIGKDPGLLQQIVGGVVGNGFMLKYSRDHEREADKVGIGYEIAAGYDPHGFITFFEKLKNGLPGILAILSSHPFAEERIENAKQTIQAAGRVPSEKGQAAYAAMQSKL